MRLLPVACPCSCLGICFEFLSKIDQNYVDSTGVPCRLTAGWDWKKFGDSWFSATAVYLLDAFYHMELTVLCKQYKVVVYSLGLACFRVPLGRPSIVVQLGNHLDLVKTHHCLDRNGSSLLSFNRIRCQIIMQSIARKAWPQRKQSLIVLELQDAQIGWKTWASPQRPRSLSVHIVRIRFLFLFYFLYSFILLFGHFGPVLFSELMGNASPKTGGRGSGLLLLLSFLFPDRADVGSDPNSVRGSTGQPSPREPDSI